MYLKNVFHELHFGLLNNLSNDTQFKLKPNNKINVWLFFNIKLTKDKSNMADGRSVALKIFTTCTK